MKHPETAMRPVGQDTVQAQAEMTLETAWTWLCRQRATAPPDADIWHLRYHQEVEKKTLLQQLLAGEYRLSPMQVVGRGAERRVMWGARDALVLKWVALQIASLLPLHERCEHVKGHGGGAASVARLSAALQQGEYPRVMRTDVKGYYGSIDKGMLLAQVDTHVPSGVLNDLIHQYEHYTVEDGGDFYTPEKGICRGCPLSPLMGALYLREMDVHFGQQPGIVYARYMDDIVILAKTRWQLRKQVRQLNQYFAQKGLRQHPDKTFIGRTSRGFDWMGAWLNDAGAQGVAPRAWGNHREKVRRLYERAWRRREAKGVTPARVSAYRHRWTIWAMALLGVACGSHAATLTAIVPQSASGIVGATQFATAAINTRSVNDGRSIHEQTAGAISIHASDPRHWCDPEQVRANLRPASNGALGVVLTRRSGGGGSEEGPLLLADGGGSWSRPNGEGGTAAGTIVYTAGRWTNTYDKGDGGGTRVEESLADGSNNNRRWACPLADHAVVWNWEMGDRRSTLSLRFLVDAPAGGLQPGRWTLGRPVLLADRSRSTKSPDAATALLADDIEVIVAAVGCSISAPASVAFSTHVDDTSSASIAVGASCGYSARNGTDPATMSASLAMVASGASIGVSADPERLGVPGSGGAVTIRGNWSSRPPTCDGPPSKSPIFFDGRGGLPLGSVQTGTTDFGVNPVSFSLCASPDAKPGAYTAQATIAIVVR